MHASPGSGRCILFRDLISKYDVPSGICATKYTSTQKNTEFQDWHTIPRGVATASIDTYCFTSSQTAVRKPCPRLTLTHEELCERGHQRALICWVGLAFDCPNASCNDIPSPPPHKTTRGRTSKET